ncbi:MAG: MFS transporter [Alphaproteobacteria bacterium]
MQRPAWRAPLIVLIAGATILTLSIGIRNSFGLFLAPMSGDLGMGREIFALSIAIQNLLWGLTQPFFGAACDRWGSGRVVAVGAALYAAGLYWMGQATTPFDLYVGGGVLIGLGLSGTSFAAVLGAVGRNYPLEKRGMALGICTAGGSLGQFLMVPIGQSFISNHGWSVGFMAFAVIVLSAAMLAIFVSGKPQQEAGSLSITEALGAARTHSGYLLLTAGFFVCGFHVTFIGTHLPAYLTDSGLPPESGATALALIGLFNIIGSFACGYFGDKFSKKWLLSGLYGARAVVILAFLLAPLTPLSAALFGAGIGLLWLGTVPLTSGLVAQIFGLRSVGTLFGIVFLSHQVGAFLGVWLGGRLFDATGSYELVWWMAVALAVLATLLHLPINERPYVRQAAAA